MPLQSSPRARGKVLLVAYLVLAACSAALGSDTQSAPLITGVDAVSMTVGDMDRSLNFYCNVLSFRKASDVEVDGEVLEHLEGVFGLRSRIVRLTLGTESIELVEYLAPKGRPIPTDSRSNDRWFQHVAIIVSDMDKAYAWLRQNRVEHASSGPQTLPQWNPNAAGIRAFYFKDPDGHPLEILQFPAGKGSEKWHRQSDQLFMGIDHTAITVANTDTSLRFYREVLGMRVVGESDNYGTEQEHLNNVFGAHLRITALRGASGPGIELLEYLSPRDGRPLPADEHANDLVHHQTTLITADAEQSAQVLQKNAANFVSSGVITDSHEQIGFKKAFLVRDPDGHVLEIAQP
jgi:catechol 2,3-dioxygenase-like lactoylglutathione lyase family enzyme